MEDEEILSIVFATLLIIALALWVNTADAYNQKQIELERLEIQLNQTQSTLVATQTQLTSTQQAREELAIDLFACMEQLEEYQKPITPPPLSNKKPPTLDRLKLALHATTIETRQYNQTFLCTDFAALLSKQLKPWGFDSHIAIIYWQPINAHAILAVNTTQGIIYVEPMSDETLTHEDLLFNYPTMNRVVSAYETWKPTPHTCIFKNKIKRCAL